MVSPDGLSGPEATKGTVTPAGGAGTLGAAVTATKTAATDNLEQAAPAEPAPVETLELQATVVTHATQGELLMASLTAAGAAGYYLLPEAAIDWTLMRLDALSKGVTLNISEAWRTYERQQQLYLRNPRKAARPGTSRHEQGYAVDIDVGAGGETGVVPKSTQYRYLVENAYRFGFQGPLKYANGKVYEAWHWEHPSDVVVGSLPGVMVAVRGGGLYLASQVKSGAEGNQFVQVLARLATTTSPATAAEKKATKKAGRAGRTATALARAELVSGIRDRAIITRPAGVRFVESEGIQESNYEEIARVLNLYNVDTGTWGDGGLT